MRHKKAKWLKSVMPTINEIEKLLTNVGVKYKICGAIRRQKKWIMRVIIVVNIPILTIARILCDWDNSIKFISNPYNAKYRIICNIKDVKFCFYTSDIDCWGATILYCTGSIRFNAVLSSRAKSFGMRLTARGLYYGELLIAGKTEKQIFKTLGMPYVPPKNRNTRNDWLGECSLIRQVKKGGIF